MSVSHAIVVLYETALDTDRQWSVPVAKTAHGEEKPDRCLVVRAVTGAAFLCTTAWLGPPILSPAAAQMAETRSAGFSGDVARENHGRMALDSRSRDG